MNAERELSRLRTLTPAELREEYGQIFNEETRSGNRGHLVRRIIWKKQALLEGDLSARARRRAKELAHDSDLRLCAPWKGKTKVIPFRPKRHKKLQMVGTILTKQYRAEEIRLLVLQHGYEHDGTIYRTLSAAARAITGTHISGPRFFNLNRRGKRRNGQ